MEEKKKVICEHCNHSWETTAKTKLVTCSGCGLKTKNLQKHKEE